MGWTHDYRDVSSDHRGTAATRRPTPGTVRYDQEQLLAIPHILRRRARWVSARLRHTTRG
ncbi:hypothetical protein SCATT_28670 [Streptantibioticus cattleyicolor NRRL 8057 = DSM 46488]|uniref:Uncharacterized protein n=1 Tax=Streptantibioticus cattleyicolor (strain ATCC 35852 / DSM 46488 / JCM 4925 / NBRC 14057 / NRRL 8057) TaxID=1003195 RepID=F8JP84_STREN|nr:MULTISPECIES: hypothetical protein [Streptomycetaceae]AEW95238.1 hypothetical protein SCATT_28670 [Streptantibioticus cattleyicolor NRRL 8057 = DSM 46488]MYS59818.1 hypothetical protein [Streptomyces sp. SID5468]CCB75582.1 conserved protein of unknown function [Streptantibioticus cattleyicolor NRRL 8057 = DSM 46488]